MNVAFDRDTLATLYRQQQGQQQPITLSWLEAPEDSAAACHAGR